MRRPHDRGHLGSKDTLGPEAPADIGRDYTKLMYGNVERVDREPPVQLMRLLTGRVERVTVARGTVFAEIGARLDRVGRHAVVPDVEIIDLRRRSHRRLRLLAISSLDLEH